jgi:membrane protease YdiL (CAAX protease family)
MPELPGNTFWGVLLLLVALANGAAVWAWIAVRAARKEPVLPHEPRQPAPWRGVDVLLVLLVYVLAPGITAHVAGRLLGIDVDQATARTADDEPQPASEPDSAEEAGAAHPLIILLGESHNLATLLFCVLVAVVTAPLVEELVFRLVIQGWMEKVELGGWWQATRGAVSLLLASAIFASLHFRVSAAPLDAKVTMFLFACHAVGSLVTIAFALSLLRLGVDASLEDLGIVRQKLGRDVLVGLLAFVAIAAPIYLLQYALLKVFPRDIAPDPITIFFFALMLGFLYLRTHRIVASVVLHMCLNATSVAMAWVITGQ